VEAAVRRFFEDVWNKGNADAAADFLADEFTSHNTVDVTVLGPDEYGQSVLGFREAFPDLVTTLEDVLSVGDRVAVRGVDRATHRGNFMGRHAIGSSGGVDVDSDLQHRIRKGRRGVARNGFS